jgi:hypothetical protein
LITTIEDIVATLERNTAQGRSIRGRPRIDDEEDAANQVSSTRVIVPLERSIRFLRGLLQIVNVANERDKRTAISILAKRVFAKILSKKQVDSAMAGAEVESREPEAELQMPPLIAAAETEEGEIPQQREEAEAEAAPAAPATPFVPITQVANKVLINEPNYQAFLAYTRKFDGFYRPNIMRKLGSLILAGATAQEAMQRMIEGNWTPTAVRR